VSDSGWEWDPTLYAGSAAYYSQGRVPYTQELVDKLVDELSLDGTGRLLDVGCGPGSLTLLLAPFFEHATGLDPDPDMLGEGARQAVAAGITNIDWVQSRAEDLPAYLGTFRVTTLAQSFHWMDRPRVARLLHGALAAEGVLVHLHATTHQGIDSAEPLPHPRPPRREIDDLVRRYLGPRRRAGQGTLPEASTDTRKWDARSRRSTGLPASPVRPGSTYRATLSFAVSTTSLRACSRSPARPRTSSATAARPSKPSSASFSNAPVPTGGSVSRCARPHSTSGGSSARLGIVRRSGAATKPVDGLVLPARPSSLSSCSASRTR
jgi:SAM-dependent methyltransferase